MKKTNEDWLDEIDEVLESLRDQRNEIEERISEDEIEVVELFEAAERRWRRIERKLEEARAHEDRPVNQGRVRNVDMLVEAIEETYYQIEQELD